MKPAMSSGASANSSLTRSITVVVSTLLVWHKTKGNVAEEVLCGWVRMLAAAVGQTFVR